MAVLLIQVLPVREIGEMLFDNQLNEEINCSGASIKELSKCNDSFDYDNLDRRIKSLKYLFMEIGVWKYVS